MSLLESTGDTAICSKPEGIWQDNCFMGFHCIAAIGAMDLATESGKDALLVPKSATLCGMQLVLPNHNIAVRLPAKRV